MSEYQYFATVYDRMMDNIPYEEWEQYILQLLFRYEVKPCASIAELGCGTGVMTRLLARDGFLMTGIDLSKEMLQVAGMHDSSDIKYIQQDMRELNLPEKQDVIISICDSMNYLLTDDDIYKTMYAVKNNLAPGGIFIFDLKTEYFFENVLDGTTYKDDMGDFSYIWRNQYNKNEHIHKYYLKFNSDGRVIRELHRQRAFSAGDIKTAAIRAGFKKAVAYNAFTFAKPKRKSERIYIILRNEI